MVLHYAVQHCGILYTAIMFSCILRPRHYFKAVVYQTTQSWPACHTIIYYAILLGSAIVYYAILAWPSLA